MPPEPQFLADEFVIRVWSGTVSACTQLAAGSSSERMIWLWPWSAVRELCAELKREAASERVPFSWIWSCILPGIRVLQAQTCHKRTTAKAKLPLLKIR